MIPLMVSIFTGVQEDGTDAENLNGHSELGMHTTLSKDELQITTSFLSMQISVNLMMITKFQRTAFI